MEAHTTANNQRYDWLSQEAKGKGPIVINARIDDRWVIFKSRFHGADRENGLIFIENPPQLAHPETTIETGQNIGISFRRGHKKCVFETQVVDPQPSGHGCTSPSPVSLLGLCWPDRIQEFQRRLYSRAKVPDRLTIPVDLCPENPRPDAAARGIAYRGLMLDLSAAGMNIALPAAKRTRLKPGDTVTCSFALEPGEEPQEISGRLRHYERVPGGHIRVGLQFLGLEASPEGCRTLQRLGQAANRFRRMETHSRSRRL